MTGAPRRLTATYRIRAGSGPSAEEIALAIAREQTLEVPAGVGGAALQARLLGRVESVRPIEGGHDAAISYDPELTGTGLPHILNVAYGNVSLMNGVRLVALDLPNALLDALPGPRFGIDGVRDIVSADAARPLVSVALKPVGLGVEALAALAATYARAGVDVIKDDHGLVDQPSAPFRERVAAVARAVAAAGDSGRRCAYFPNVTGPVDTLEERLATAQGHGCAGVLLCPALTGLDVMRSVAAGGRPLAIMAHPAHAQSAPGRREGIAPEVLFGTLYRAAGADVVVYVNARGRFSWPVETCEEINARLRGPLGRMRPAFPAPAGGVEADDAREWLERYGPDTMLLIGGSLLARDDVERATRALVEAARSVAPGAPAATSA